jgi:CheY-like chemotaxis protein
MYATGIAVAVTRGHASLGGALRPSGGRRSAVQFSKAMLLVATVLTVRYLTAHLLAKSGLRPFQSGSEPLHRLVAVTAAAHSLATVTAAAHSLAAVTAAAHHLAAVTAAAHRLAAVTAATHLYFAPV